MFNDTQHPIYVPAEVATIVQAIVNEVVSRKGVPRAISPKARRTFYDTNILVGARAICEALHSHDNPTKSTNASLPSDTQQEQGATDLVPD